MNAQLFKAVLRELIDANPFACRALLSIVDTEFTDDIETLAVTTGAQPRLLVNLQFVRKYCRKETHLKAVICHEFLHVLLRHTDRINPLTAADHLALDAVINAIIHRELGPDYSGMMMKYYAAEKGVRRLLRPYTENELDGRDRNSTVVRAWQGLYDGHLVADDIRDLARDLGSGRRAASSALLLGNHRFEGDAKDDVSPAVAAALDRSLKSMNGEGIWRAPQSRGAGALAYVNRVTAADDRVARWRRQTWEVLRRHVMPHGNVITDMALSSAALPLLSPCDRRSFARALWSPLLPAAEWPTTRVVRSGRTQVYLDVSGSMYAEMPLVIALLLRLSRFIQRPFWAFSDIVAPAVIRGGQLVAETSGGTAMACVLKHLEVTRPAAAVVVTDGYIETLQKSQLQTIAGTRLHVVVTRDGSTAQLTRAGIACTQLGRLAS